MGTHNDHTINDNTNNQWPGKEFRYEQKKKRNHAEDHHPANKGYPIFPGFQNIHSAPGLCKQLPFFGNNKLPFIIRPSIGWFLKDVIYKSHIDF